MPCTPKVAWKLLPALLLVGWHMVFITMGTMAVSEDQALRDEECGRKTHLIKYSVLNLMSALFSVVTYLVFPGGGEGARARATMLTIIAFGFVVWGILMYTAITATCWTIVEDKFSALFDFFLVCILHNAVMGTLVAAHELWIGHHYGMDFTVVAKISNVKTDEFSAHPVGGFGDHQTQPLVNPNFQSQQPQPIVRPVHERPQLPPVPPPQQPEVAAQTVTYATGQELDSSGSELAGTQSPL